MTESIDTAGAEGPPSVALLQQLLSRCTMSRQHWEETALRRFDEILRLKDELAEVREAYVALQNRLPSPFRGDPVL